VSPGTPLALATVIFLIVLYRWSLIGPRVSHSHRRGRQLKTSKEIDSILEKALAPTDATFRLGNRKFPARLAHGHIAVVGATGSGKTMVQRLLLQSVLDQVGRGLGHRAILYDAKQDALSLLAGMDVKCRVRLLNPLDVRASAWDMARDITAPASALQAAAMLIPETKGDANPFFTNAARHLLYGTLLGLIASRPGKWTLREAILIVRDKGQLKNVLASVTQNAALLQYFEHAPTLQNILSTVLTYTAPYEILAATWAHANDSFSLNDWLSGEGILILGNDEGNRTALDTINRLIFRRLTELILRQPETDPRSTRRTWFFLDEVREAGNLDGLSRLLTKGRSKGAAVVLGFQDIAGLRDLYGKGAADELVGQCNTKIFLRLNSPETAEWASKVIGSQEVFEIKTGISKNREARHLFATSSGESLSHGISETPLVLPSEFLALPETTPETGLSGFVVTPLTGPYRMHLPGDWLARELTPRRVDFPDLVLRPDSHQYLVPLGPGELNHGDPTPKHSPNGIRVDRPRVPISNPLPKRSVSDRTTPHALNCVLENGG
jgi:type IV secretory pathway TraG/TraD family ATPase VirD4